MKRILIIWALLISTVFAQSKAGFYVVGGKIITVQDTSSRKYLKAIEDAGVVPSTVQNFASNYLVTTERAIGTWTLMKAQYPFIGGTAATHKFNLNDPRDLDAAFRLTYSGTITHNNNGLTFAGAGSANTFFNPSVELSVNATIGNSTSSYTSGVENSILFNSGGIVQRFSNSMFGSTSFFSQFRTNIYTVTVNNGLGFKLSTTSSAGIRGFYKGIKVIDNATVSGSYPNANFIIGARNASAGGVFTLADFLTGTINYQMLSNDVFTDQQAILQSRAVTSFEGFLGRQ